jgi:hypothetical protein
MIPTLGNLGTPTTGPYVDRIQLVYSPAAIHYNDIVADVLIMCKQGWQIEHANWQMLEGQLVWRTVNFIRQHA